MLVGLIYLSDRAESLGHLDRCAQQFEDFCGGRLGRDCPPSWKGWRANSTIQSERKEKLHQVAFLRAAEVETEEGIVVIHHVTERREPTVVIEASLLMAPKAGQG